MKATDGLALRLRHNMANGLVVRNEQAWALIKCSDALGALGVIGSGYCFCSKDRAQDKVEHEPECQEARAALFDLEQAQ